MTFAFALLVPAFASAKTVVSLQFDDGTTDQLQAASILQSHGMRGTFFINSGRIGASGYMTVAQIQGLQSAGHEIGGHTIDHADLPTLTKAQATAEVCNDRTALLADGFQVHDFAYPFGAYDSTVEQIVQGCGYDSAREIGDLVTPTSCSGCDFAETIPPRDLYAIRTPGSIQSNETLSQIEASVTGADSHGGGWLPLVMHHVCSLSDPNCDPQYSIDPATLSAFLDWLQARVSAGTDVVETVHQVIGGTGPGGPSAFTMNTPASPASASISLSLSSQPTDAAGIKNVVYQYRPSGSTGAWSTACTATAAQFSCNWTTSPGSPADGTYSLQAVATDNNSQSTTASNAPVGVTLANGPGGPSAFQMNTPASPASGNVSLSLSSQPTDSAGIKNVVYQYRPSGSTGAFTSACTATAAPWSCNWVTSAGSPADGTYSLQAVATDNNNLSTTASNAPVSVTISNGTGGPSAFTMNTPASPASGNVELSLSSQPTDSSGIKNVVYQYRLSGQTGSFSTACTATAAPWSCSWATSAGAPPDGTYDLVATATDNTNLSTTATNAPVSVTISNGTGGGPSAFTMNTPSSPASGTVALSLSSQPTDAAGIKNVVYQYRPSGSTGAFTTACTATAAPWSCNWATSPGSPADGTYSLQAVATDNNNLSTTASNAPVSVTVGAAPVAQFSVTTSSPRAASPISFNGSGSGSTEPGGSIASYSWNFGDGSAAGSGATPSHTYSSAGAYNVTLTVSDANGYTASVTHALSVAAASVVPPPAKKGVPTAGFTITPAKPVALARANFSGSPSTDIGSTLVSYAWSFGDRGTASGVTASHTYGRPGIYHVTLIVRDATGVSASSTRTVTVLSPGFTGVKIKTSHTVELIRLSLSGPGTLIVGRHHIRVRRAGVSTYRLVLSRAQRAKLHSHHRLHIKIAFRFAPKVGTASRWTVAFTVKP